MVRAGGCAHRYMGAWELRHADRHRAASSSSSHQRRDRGLRSTRVRSDTRQTARNNTSGSIPLTGAPPPEHGLGSFGSWTRFGRRCGGLHQRRRAGGERHHRRRSECDRLQPRITHNSMWASATAAGSSGGSRSSRAIDFNTDDAPQQRSSDSTAAFGAKSG